MKVGDYVRTNYGTISKLEAIDEDIILGNKGYLDKENIIKSSPNIIDLIEVGDYVNGLKIDDITEKDIDHPEIIVWHLTCYGDDDIPFRNDEIKSIVTKEQFESMEYKVGD